MKERVIGLELAYKTSNYGAQLQAYATQQVIKRLGFKTKIISLNPSSIDTHIIGPGFLHYCFTAYQFKRIRKKTRENISDEVYLKNRANRKIAYLNFINERLENVIDYQSYRALKNDAKNYFAAIIGSDQKWLPGACYDKLATLSFAPKGVRRISYATSLGVSEYPRYCWFMSRKMWKKIDFLSVREQQGEDIIKRICGDISVEVVVDPTYLLTKKEWEDLVPVESKLNERYILCYFLGNNDESKRCARRFADNKGLKVVSIMSDESFSLYDKEYADVLVQGERPEDFINWIRGSEYIFTDSFHGTAFSVINEKQFFVFYRKRLDAKLNRNSRIDNILSKWDLNDRLIKDNDVDWNVNMPEYIDYTKVSEIVKSEREHSISFLKKALKFDENK